MTPLRLAGWALLVTFALSVTSAAAQPEAAEPAAAAAAPKAKAQGIAVVGIGSSREEAFVLARAVYASALRPRGLDELRARILAGDPPPPTASKEIRDLAELRAAVTGDGAASRQLLSSIANQLGVQGLLVVSVTRASSAPAQDGGVEEGASDGGTITPPSPPSVTARLFLAETGDFDAARYEPEAGGWRGTVTSLSARFPLQTAAPAPAQLQGAPPKLVPGKEEKPFYKSPWLWGAVGAAVLVGGFFFFASQDTGDDPIHLQMRVPR